MVQAPARVKELDQARYRVSQLEKGLSIVDGRGYNVLAGLAELVKHVPPGVPLKVRELTIDGTSIHLEGETTTFDAVEKIKQAFVADRDLSGRIHQRYPCRGCAEPSRVSPHLYGATAMMQMLKERWQHFSQRERIIVSAGGAMVAAALVFLLIIDPLMATIDKLDRQARRKAKDSQELALVAQEYVVKQARIATLEQRMPIPPAQFSLLAFMEEATTTAQIRDRIVGMQPQAPIVVQGYQETAVDLRLDGVSLPQILALLVAIDQAPYDVQVHHLQLKPKYDNPVNLDATLRIVTYAKV